MSPWPVLRAWLNLPVTLPACLLARAAGSRCEVGRDLFVVCSGAPRWLNGPRGGMTVGGVFLTSGPAPGEALRRHETRHADQWALVGALAFPLAYGLAEVVGRRRGGSGAGNLFERLAGLADGGYTTS